MRRAAAAGISIESIAEQALQRAVVEASGGTDDASRYRQGLVFGQEWAQTTATSSERKELAQLRSERWSGFGLNGATHSLVPLLFEAGELDRTTGTAWLERGPFTEGIIDAAAEDLSS